MNIVLKSNSGKVIRVFSWGQRTAEVPNDIFLIYRNDSRRLDLTFHPNELMEQGVDFEVLSKVNKSQGEGTIYTSATGVTVELTQEVPVSFEPNVENKEDQSLWYKSLGVIALFGISFSLVTANFEQATEEIKEELKQHVVKIMKKNPPKRRQVQITHTNFGKRTQKVSTKKSKKSVSRLGALGVLGSLKKSRQKGGVNLNAANTTAGPGLGGTAGSGGVQTTLYGKGIVAAPVGVGGNLKGGGGYGTKGKGGGKAGYGSLSLVGSAGTGLVPLGKEAVIQGGLDRDMIAAVIARNMGQVRFCYEQGLQSDPKLAGRVAINFTISSAGTVSTTNLKSTTLNSRLVEDCIMARLRSWKFPLPEGGVDVKVSYPFLLRRLGRG